MQPMMVSYSHTCVHKHAEDSETFILGFSRLLNNVLRKQTLKDGDIKIHL